MSWQAESRRRVASSSTGLTRISSRISEALMSGTIRVRLGAGLLSKPIGIVALGSDRVIFMSLRFHWFLPTNGDGRDIVGGGHGVATGTAGTIRPATLAYLGQVARSAEQLGFEAALTPTGVWCEDAWVVTAMLTEVTERLKFLVAFRPGLVSPLLAAQMATTFQRHSQGRLLLNVVTGGESAEQRAYGDFLDKPQRYARCAEFLDITTRLWRGETVTHDGAHLRTED